MITKAIVEEIISPYEVRVRVPILDKAAYDGTSTKTKDLNIATICSLPNCNINPQVGDIVFVAFEDNTYYKAVIIGFLSRQAMTNTCSSLVLNELVVENSVTLSSLITIGDVTSEEIQRLSGVTDNIQKQLNALKEQQERLLKAVFNA